MNGEKDDGILEIAFLVAVLYQLLVETKIKNTAYTQRNQFRDAPKYCGMRRPLQDRGLGLFRECNHGREIGNAF